MYHSYRAKVGLAALFFLLLIPVGAAIAPQANVLGMRAARWLNPVIAGMTATDWRLDTASGLWSAEISGRKIDGACDFVRDQAVTALLRLRPGAYPDEIPVVFLDDDTPGSNRPPGLQSFGRWQFQAAGVPKGAIVIATVRHRCPDSDQPVISPVGPFTVGGDT